MTMTFLSGAIASHRPLKALVSLGLHAPSGGSSDKRSGLVSGCLCRSATGLQAWRVAALASAARKRTGPWRRYLLRRPATQTTNTTAGLPERPRCLPVLICVKPNLRKCAFFKVEGKYQKDDGKEVIVFRRGEVFWRENTRSVRITMEGLDDIIERRFAARRAELLREWATAQRALSHTQAPAPTPRLEASFALPSNEVTPTVIELLRQRDDIGLRQLLDDGRRRARTYIEDEELAKDQLPTLLDSIVCVAATFLTYEQDVWFERTIPLLVDAYAAVADADEVKRLGISSHLAPTAKAPPSGWKSSSGSSPSAGWQSDSKRGRRYERLAFSCLDRSPKAVMRRTGYDMR